MEGLGIRTAFGVVVIQHFSQMGGGEMSELSEWSGEWIAFWWGLDKRSCVYRINLKFFYGFVINMKCRPRILEFRL